MKTGKNMQKGVYKSSCGDRFGGACVVCTWVGENWLAPTGGHGCPFPKPPPPLLARRDGAVTTGIHSPPVPPPYPQRWWYLCPVYSGCIP